MSRISKVAAVMAGTGALIAGGAGLATADSGAEAVAAHSPGVGSGNAVQVPVHIPVNVCGNTVNVIALLNPAFGNTCANVPDNHHDKGGYGY
ncbi:chaplin [Streptomyces sp. NBC_01102]|uniref:chaplin n=1 Tax=unclassified Streptomyces TaxID=2593676 RepID=UPI0038644557|nr:chaplin [Streptomyces sp. NBC_01102]